MDFAEYHAIYEDRGQTQYLVIYQLDLCGQFYSSSGDYLTRDSRLSVTFE